MATTLTTPLAIDYPEVAGPLELRIQAGACRLKVEPADQEPWITGTYNDPSQSISVTTETDGNHLLVRVGSSLADFLGFLSGIPELTLRVGKARPFALLIAAGASETHIDLGGLPLLRLELNHGAGSMDVTFSTPNPEAMTLMKLGVGAGRTMASKLGNASFTELSVEGGASACVLDFSGAIPKPADVRLSTAMGAIEARIPAAVPAVVTSESLLGHPSGDGGFVQQGMRWVSKSAAQGTEPLLHIRSSMVLGSLSLVTI